MTTKEKLRQIQTVLQKKIDNALTREVFEEVVDEEIATIHEVVYKVYAPRMYRRRGDFGGMADPYNIEMKGGAAKGGVLTVANMTEPNPGGCFDDSRVTTGKNLPELIEFGHGYKFYQYDFPKRGAAYMEPRPFTAKTIEHLKAGKAHISALKEGLRRQGLKVN